jgi:nitroreductase
MERRTVNDFKTIKVDQELVNVAIRAAIAAPNHKMTEPWRFILLGDKTISEIAALNAADISKKDPVKGAKKKERWQAIPGWCVVTSAKSRDGKNDALQEREDYAATCCAIQNFMLSLWANGVGTKWTTGPITRTPEFAQLCGIDPSIEEVAGCIWYGIPSTNQQDIPVPKRKKSVEDVTSWRP